MGMVYGNFNQKIFQNLNIPYISTIKGAKKAPLKVPQYCRWLFLDGEADDGTPFGPGTVINLGVFIA